MADVTEEDIVKMRLLFDGDGLGRTFLYLLILIITLKELLQLGAQLNIELGGGGGAKGNYLSRSAKICFCP